MSVVRAKQPKLTKRRALKLSLEIWRWLADRPAETTIHYWPKTKLLGLNGSAPIINILCDYTFKNHKGRCDGCPLIKLFESKKVISAIALTPCRRTDNPYRKWSYAKTEEREQLAKQMVSACVLALRELDTKYSNVGTVTSQLSSSQQNIQ